MNAAGGLRRGGGELAGDKLPVVCRCSVERKGQDTETAPYSPKNPYQ